MEPSSHALTGFAHLPLQNTVSGLAAEAQEVLSLLESRKGYMIFMTGPIVDRWRRSLEQIQKNYGGVLPPSPNLPSVDPDIPGGMVLDCMLEIEEIDTRLRKDGKPGLQDGCRNAATTVLSWCTPLFTVDWPRATMDATRPATGLIAPTAAGTAPEATPARESLAAKAVVSDLPVPALVNYRGVVLALKSLAEKAGVSFETLAAKNGLTLEALEAKIAATEAADAAAATSASVAAQTASTAAASRAAALEAHQKLEASRAALIAKINAAFGGPAPDAAGEQGVKAQADTAAEAAHRSPSAPARHSTDFRSVHWYGVDYAFTEEQARIVKVLWEQWENGTPDIGYRTCLSEANCDRDRLQDVFKNKGQMHPAWEKMIAPSATTKGSCRLKSPG